MDPIAELLKTYSELNSSEVTELFEEPSPLEFMRFVASNRPFVVRGGVLAWKATKVWNLKYLIDAMENQSVNVAITAKGNADSPVSTPEGNFLFVKPLEEERPFQQFINYVATQELESRTDEEVWYAQTQNDNLRGEYSTLFADVHKDIPWARIALQMNPEAINLWIGNSRSVSALHKDNYENIYCQIVGQKHFVLLPPIAQFCIGEMNLPPVVYRRHGGSLIVEGEEEKGGDEVPFATWDPDDPTANPTRYSHLAGPLRTTLEAGDMLYLPALWHDMSYGGSFFPLCSFARGIALDTAIRESEAQKAVMRGNVEKNK